MDVNKVVWGKFHFKPRDTVPYISWVGNRSTLAELFNDLGYKTGAEIGVRQGEFSEIICKAVPGVKLKCIDPYLAYARNRWVAQDEQDAIYAEAVQRLSPYNVEFIKQWSMDAVRDVPDLSLDFVHVDGEHGYDNTMLDIIFWSSKVRSGGIVSGHDYIPGYQLSVIQAVHDYTSAHGINFWYVIRETIPTYFWVKP
jgi:hypothetical protein